MDPTALIRYWRLCLADVDLRAPEVGQENYALTRFELEEGKINAGLVEKIFDTEEAENKHRRGKRQSEEEPPGRVSLLIAPLRLRRLTSHANAYRLDNKVYHPFWIAANLERNGELTGEPEVGCWFDRRHLEPMRGEQPSLGTLAAFDEVLTRNRPPASDSWPAHYAHALKIFAAVADRPLRDFTLDDFENVGMITLRSRPQRGAGRGILDLYDVLLDGTTTIPPLLQTLLAGSTPTPPPTPWPEGSLDFERRHLGQMTSGFPLAPSQRQALSTTLGLRDGELLAVNGPPGTGKTTLLRSVIASFWVEAALAGGEPPIILACSSNNRAITNVLDSLDKVGGESTERLAQRWLPDLRSYGLYLPAVKRFQDGGAGDYQVALPGKQWKGLPGTMEDADYVARAEADYLDNARSALSGSFQNVAKVVEHLHARIHATAREIEALLEDGGHLTVLRRQKQVGSAAEAQMTLMTQRTRLIPILHDHATLHQETLTTLENLPFWEELLAFLPPVRRRLERRLKLPFIRRNAPVPMFDRSDFAETLIEHCRQLAEPSQTELGELEAWQAREERFAAGLDRLLTIATDKTTAIQAARDRPETLPGVLDVTLRYHLFLLAGRYWEGRWLLEMKRLLASTERLEAQSRKACEARLRRLAMVTPCMIATFYRAPKVFDYYDRDRGAGMPLWGTIDLLIVDEAGQATPEVGAAAFALARKALVVGDIHQIEPIWGIPSTVDAANLKSAGMTTPTDPDAEAAIAYRASQGSVMLLARRATTQSRTDERGLLLSEHRRCVPEIIDFCNRLVYRGRLEPLRPALAERILPAMGWAHVTSPEVGTGSRANPGEAHAIASWLVRNRERIEQKYGKELRDLVAIITPFAAQRWALTSALRKAGLTDVEAGTVHTFQGGERPVVLFSPVYSYGTATKYFFDDGSNMLNVAVSRAQDSFLVFGDMRLFRTSHRSLPSGSLASFLFASPDNEITDVESPQDLVSLPQVERVTTLERHRELLREALEQCVEQVLIVSPYLSPAAIEAEALEDQIAGALERGARVVVAYDRFLTRDPLNARLRAQLNRLRNAGAVVRELEGFHNKTLAVDRRWIAEGSFNWLSANRQEGHPWQRHEVSFCYRGSEAPSFIRNAWKEVAAAGELE